MGKSDVSAMITVIHYGQLIMLIKEVSLQSVLVITRNSFVVEELKVRSESGRQGLKTW